MLEGNIFYWIVGSLLLKSCFNVKMRYVFLLDILKMELAEK